MCATVAIDFQTVSKLDPESSPNVRHRRQRYPNRFPMCATVAIETQTETRIDRTIVPSYCSVVVPTRLAVGAFVAALRPRLSRLQKRVCLP